MVLKRTGIKVGVGRRELILLIGAILIALLIRLPGVWWGSNFPFGWHGHHPDEYTHAFHAQLQINPHKPEFNIETSPLIGMNNPWAAGYSVTPYPVALAMHVALPIIVTRVMAGSVSSTPPPPSGIIPQGRTVSAIYGAATVIVVFFIARCLFLGSVIPIVAAWMMAFGGLHVTQSHFFLADVPALFWFLLGILFLWYDQADTKTSTSMYLALGALCFGFAFGLKLFFAGVPSLGVVVLSKSDRVWRIILAVVFFLFGVTSINFGMYTPHDFFRTVFRGIADPFEFSILASIMLYIAELPSIISLPLFLASLAGIIILFRKYVRLSDNSLKWRIGIIFILPMLLHLFLVIFVLDHFPRHLIPFIPWLLICSAWVVVKLSSHVSSKFNISGLTVILPVFIYLAVFVYDGEKGFISEPRNKAAEWLNDNISKGTTLWWYYHNPQEYKPTVFPDVRPDVIVEEMHHANHYLSGMGLRDSLPRDHRFIFDSHSQKYIDEFQALFTKETDYKKTVRFNENYFMPEYTITDKFIGNRSRNYLAEVVIFVRDQKSEVNAAEVKREVIN